MGDVLQFRQKRNVTGDDIQDAPNIVSESHIPVRCLGTEGQTVPLECCVQSPFKVNWFRGSLAPIGSLALGKFKMFQKTSQSDHTENTPPITVYFINNTVKCLQHLLLLEMETHSVARMNTR